MCPGMSISKGSYKGDPRQQHLWTHTVPSGVEGQHQGEASSAAHREVPHLFPSLHHMEVPATCSQHSSALAGIQRTDSLQEEEKNLRDEESILLQRHFRALDQAVKQLLALEEMPHNGNRLWTPRSHGRI